MGHSLTGASSTKRWLNCSGYLSLARGSQGNPERLDPDYTREGTAAHLIAARCMTEGRDAWEFMGYTIEGCVVGQGEGQVDPLAVQEYIDHCRSLCGPDMQVWIETPIGADESKRPHPGFYGTLDFAVLDNDAETLRVRDLKFGEGVYVDVTENEQEMYYAYGLLLWLDDQGITVPLTWKVELGIVQPRFYDYVGPRTWTTTVHAILTWGATVLIPAMEAADTKAPEFVPGDWCRFCPCKLQCPALRGMFKAAVEASTSVPIKEVTDDDLGREFQQIPLARMYIKAVDDETNYRLLQGRTVEGVKLGEGKVDRVWKSGAIEAMQQRFGEAALTTRELKSPNQMEKLGEGAKQEVARWAFKPKAKPKAVLANSAAPTVRVSTVAEKFASFVK